MPSQLTGLQQRDPRQAPLARHSVRSVQQLHQVRAQLGAAVRNQLGRQRPVARQRHHVHLSPGAPDHAQPEPDQRHHRFSHDRTTATTGAAGARPTPATWPVPARTPHTARTGHRAGPTAPPMPPALRTTPPATPPGRTRSPHRLPRDPHRRWRSPTPTAPPPVPHALPDSWESPPGPGRLGPRSTRPRRRPNARQRDMRGTRPPGSLTGHRPPCQTEISVSISAERHHDSGTTWGDI